MLKKNKAHTEFDFTDGFSTFAYPYIQEKDTTLALKQPFIDSITDNLIYKDYSEYFLINRALYSALMGK